jgi:hypothetical protein
MIEPGKPGFAAEYSPQPGSHQFFAVTQDSDGCLLESPESEALDLLGKLG